jgi:DNA repair exonuclease SbcCD ATPase subunit
MGGTPARGDLDYYYGNLEKQTNDRLEIIEYLIDTQGGGDDEMDKKFKEVLDGIKAQMSQLQEEKEDAYKRAGL